MFWESGECAVKLERRTGAQLEVSLRPVGPTASPSRRHLRVGDRREVGGLRQRHQAMRCILALISSGALSE